MIRATACDPPKTRSSRSSAATPNDARAASRSIPAKERIGVPDTKLRAGKASARVGGKETATRVAKRAMARGRAARDHVPLPHDARNAARARGGDEREGEVAAGREDGRPAAAGRGARQAWGTAAARRSGSSTRCRSAPALRSERTTSWWYGISRHRPPAGARSRAHRRCSELKPGLRVAQGPCDGQCGVDVPAGPAA